MTSTGRLTLAAAVAVALACSALAPMYAGLGWLLPTLFGITVVAGTGALARRVRLPVLLVAGAQLLALATSTALLYVGQTLDWLLPTDRTWPALQALAVEAAADVARLAAPVPTRPALVLLAVLGGGLVAVLVDLAAVGLRRAALAGLPLLVLLAVPSAVLPGGLGWLPFTLGAAGWLGLLLVEGTDRVGRWGTPLRAGRAALDDAPSAGRVGRRIGAAALGMAAIVPALVPGLDAQLIAGLGGGSGGEGGMRTTVTYNPMTRLQGELTRPVPIQVLRYRTNDEAPDYLRMTTLDRFDGRAWSSSPLRGRGLDDSIPAPVDSGSSPARTVNAEIQLDDHLRSQWLPAPATPREVTVKGRWRWDPISETVFATATNTSRVDDYTVRATRVLPDPALLRVADEMPAEIEHYQAPVEVDPRVEALTREVVGGLDGPYEQAVALQEFFLDPAQGFVYDTETAPLRNRDALSAFLEERRGYCEQYASAMAVMLRLLGIPSRVGVGFTPGRELEDGSRVVTTDDAHAWPEAWFEGAGWVRFEPTPTSDGRAIVPEYTVEEEDEPTGSGTTADGGPAATAGPAGASPTVVDRRLREGDPLAPVDPLAAGEESAGGVSSRVVGPAGVAAVLAATPALVAALRRRRRWRSLSPSAAWDQVHDDAADLGHRWRSCDSPQAAAARLAVASELPGPARKSLDRLAAAVARSRYARGGDGTAPEDLRADARAVRRALLASSDWRRRLRAVVAPPSTIRWLGSRSAGLVADGLDRVDELLAVLPRRLRARRPAG